MRRHAHQPVKFSKAWFYNGSAVDSLTGAGVDVDVGEAVSLVEDCGSRARKVTMTMITATVTAAAAINTRSH